MFLGSPSEIRPIREAHRSAKREIKKGWKGGKNHVGLRTALRPVCVLGAQLRWVRYDDELSVKPVSAKRLLDSVKNFVQSVPEAV